MVSDAQQMEIMSRYVSAPYYVESVEEAKVVLEKHGVCILRVLDNSECDALEQGIWKWLEHATSQLEKPVERGRPETYRSFYELQPSHGMLLQHWGVGHAEFAWAVRQHPRVVKMFSHLWGVHPEDLLCSFDGAAISLPHEVTNRGFFRGNTWLHTDQSYLRPTYECVQAWVTARDVNEGDATLAFIPGSHKLHNLFAGHFGVQSKQDWFKLSLAQQQWYIEQAGSEVQYIKCTRGCMVLWDSRTIHSGQEALRDRPSVNTRMAVYVCMTPRHLAKDQKVLVKRIRAFEALRMTAHWPHKVKLFGKHPQLYGKPAPLVPQPRMPYLTPLGRRLVGYNQ